MKYRLIASGLAITALITACGGSSPQAVTTPTIKVIGTCSDPQGFRLQTTGFTPGGAYQTEANYPDGRPYTYLLNNGVGTADAHGNLSNWTWDCKRGANNQPDPNGKYFLEVTNITTNQSATTYFIVDERK